MDKQTCENHIAILKKVRGACDSQLDAGVKAELDAVIEALERFEPDHGAERAMKLAERALQIIAVIVKIMTDIGGWM